MRDETGTETLPHLPDRRDCNDHAGRIVLLGDPSDWHGSRLLKAFRAGGVEPFCTSLTRCGFAPDAPAGIALRSADGRVLPDLPSGVFVRSVPPGTFEQVTLTLGVLHALRDAGVRVWNDARAIERCVDKSTTTFRLRAAGIATPDTWATTDRAVAEQVAAQASVDGRLLVQKPLFGSQGRGLRLIRGPGDLAAGIDVRDAYYLQAFVGDPSVAEASVPAGEPVDGASIEGGGRDWRIFVSAGRIVAAMTRHGRTWITNVRQGARAESAEPDGPRARLAVVAAAAVGADYAGVDVIDAVDGSPMVLEVNSMPAWQALERVSRVSIAQELVGDFLVYLRTTPNESAVPVRKADLAGRLEA